MIQSNQQFHILLSKEQSEFHRAVNT